MGYIYIFIFLLNNLENILSLSNILKNHHHILDFIV